MWASSSARTADTVTYTYTNRLRTRLSLQAPDGAPWTVSYAYDAAKRLTGVTSPAGAFAYAYDSVRQLLPATVTLPSGATIADTYDPVARLLSTTLKNPASSILNSHAYTYNLAGQRSWATNTLGDYRAYTYDNAGQLKTALGYSQTNSPRWQEQFGYAYDAAGNLNFRTNYALLDSFNVNSLNELSNVAPTGTLTVAGTTTSPATNVTVLGSSGAVGFVAGVRRSAVLTTRVALRLPSPIPHSALRIPWAGATPASPPLQAHRSSPVRWHSG